MYCFFLTKMVPQFLANASSAASFLPSPSLTYLIFFVLLLANQISAQAYSNMSLGTTLTPLTQHSSWLSPSGDFAFGFRPLETNPTLYLLAIWFNKIANNTVVWTANGDNPVADGSKVELTSDGRLSLKDPTGQEIWNPGVRNVSFAALLDTGNFVLVSAPSDLMWQSFDNPTDTILPGQALIEGTTLYSRLMDDDYSRGRFKLVMQKDGNLVFYAIDFLTATTYGPYWATGTNGSGIQLMFNQSGSIYLSFQNRTVYSLSSQTISAGNYYQRATLNPDGIFRQYSFLKNELNAGTWEVIWRIDLDICQKIVLNDGSGACGFNSYCTTDPGGFVDCRCPPHYSFIDPNRKYEGCAPDFTVQDCKPGGEAQYDFAEMPNVNWPLGDAEILSQMNESACRDNCLNDCFCAAAIYNDGNNGSCWKKRYPLSNGRTGDRGKALIKYSMYIGSTKKRNWSAWILVGSLLLGSSVVLNLVLSIFYSCRKNWCKLPLDSSCQPDPVLHLFTYKELEQATNGFSEEIGRGGFSVVYKGILASQPATPIAVKKLDRVFEEAEKDFANEVATVCLTHHKHLVRLLGFCREGTNRLLVFEFMSNGSLKSYLFGSDRPNWNQRVQIALGIAGGLAYLHEECRTQIIHCDIKPQNILLDENYAARISDFGLAKLLGLEQTRTSTAMRGTIGYFAPEWFKKTAITAKVDVYSFGVMLLEIICCRRNFEWGLESQEIVPLIDFAKECYRSGRLDLLVEEDDDAKADKVRLEKFVMVAISCIQDEPWLRPPMKQVVQMLEGAISVSIPADMYSINL